VPVDVSAHDLNTGQTMTLYSQVADETDIGLPLGASLVDAVAPIEAGQAATAIFNGPPAFESGNMCAQIWLRESRLPLSFCNRYVAPGAAGDAGPVPPGLAFAVTSDLSTAFTLLEQVAFANLHVTRVSAEINAQRGLAEGSLVSAHAPARVHPGQLITVRLAVRAFRGAMQTISFRMRVPRHARGLFTASLRGPSQVLPTGGPSGNLFGGGLAALAELFGGSGGPQNPPPPAQSVAQLRGEIAAMPVYDGLVLSGAGQHGRHVFRDPSLLITGRARLVFVVK
jgi:hypothetical protein